MALQADEQLADAAARLQTLVDRSEHRLAQDAEQVFLSLLLLILLLLVLVLVVLVLV